MEFQTPLNQAHSYVRRAEKFFKTRKFDEAIELQDKIVELLSEALSEARDPKLEESIRAQIEFHSKQKEVIRVKAVNWEEFCRAVAALQIRMSNISGDGSGDGLQDSIFRTFQETESLLEHLRVGTLVEATVPSQPSTGAKMPKDDKIIIEELQTANNHLRRMVESMFAELETYKKENSDLRARVKDLEAERRLRQGGAGPAVPARVGLQLEDSGDIPDLAPLEMPQFDFPSEK